MIIKAILTVVLLNFVVPVLILLALVFPAFIFADEGLNNNKKPVSENTSNVKAEPEVKKLSGISIIGNKEAPKSLYIVPWQDSEVGVASSFNSGLLDDSMRPIDKEVFLRELEYYRLSHGNKP